jgi:glycosyltransferase involved in cell wall biosynthesis
VDAQRPLVSVVIPCRPSDVPSDALTTLFRQDYSRLELHVIVDWKARGQSWARNRGLERCGGELVLFSDYDVRWAPDAVSRMLVTLREAQHEHDQAPTTSGLVPWKTGYAYGCFDWMLDGRPYLRLGEQQWDWGALRQKNFVPTMALVDRACLGSLRFDETLARLEDWDLWLQLAALGTRGVWTGSKTFETDVKPGVSWESDEVYADAYRTVRRKHGIR